MAIGKYEASEIAVKSLQLPGTWSPLDRLHKEEAAVPFDRSY